MVNITVELPAEKAALFEKALDKVTQHPGVSHAGTGLAPDEESSWSAMQADAVVNLDKYYLTPAAHKNDSGESIRPQQGTSVADHYQVMIHVDHEAALSGREGSADLPIETVKRL